MRQTERELDRYLNLLRSRIRERGFTQVEVQEALGWGRSYISQLMTKSKALRVEQVLMILNVIGVEPAEFFAELYPPGSRDAWSREPASRSLEPRTGVAVMQEFGEFKALLQGLAGLLVDKRIVASSELRTAVEAEARGD